MKKAIDFLSKKNRMILYNKTSTQKERKSYENKKN